MESEPGAVVTGPAVCRIAIPNFPGKLREAPCDFLDRAYSKREHDPRNHTKFH